MSQLDRVEKKLDLLLELLGETPDVKPVVIPAVTSYRRRCQEALEAEAANIERRQRREGLRQ